MENSPQSNLQRAQVGTGEYDRGATVERLIAVVRAEGLFPDYLGGYFDNLIGAMKAGLPKVRDKDGGHGAAPADPPVPDHIAGFALHLAASNIVMLVQAYRALPATPKSWTWPSYQP